MCPLCVTLLGCPVCFVLYAGLDVLELEPADEDAPGRDEPAKPPPRRSFDEAEL